MASKYTVVPISARTGRPVKKPRKGVAVTYAVQGPRGGLKPLRKDPQPFSDTDLKTLRSIVAKSDGKHFVLYEQFTTRVLKDSKGRPQYRQRDGVPVLDARGRKIPLRVTKITGRVRDGKQRAVVYSMEGRRPKSSVPDFTFRHRTKREQVDAKLARIVPLTKPKEGAYTEELHLTGATIFDTIKNLKPAISGKDMARRSIRGLMVEGVVRVRNPDGSLAAALTFSTRVNALWNFSQLVAKDVRHALAQVGYRFTSLAELSTLQRAADKRPGKEIDLFRMGPVGRRGVDRLQPLRPETKKGTPAKRGAAMSVSVSVKVTGIHGAKKSRKRGAKK